MLIQEAIKMNSTPENNILKRREKALKRYDDEIQWYERGKRNQRRAFQLFQVCIIVFSGLTPLLILIDGFPKPLQALPAAAAGMLAGILATFRLQDNYTRFAYTLEMLKSEKFRFETRSTKDYGVNVDDQKALERFVHRMEELIINEVADWRQTTIKKDEEAK
jgi:hypothetical protein